MVRAAVSDGVRTVVVNLEGATGVDSSAVSDLASAHMALTGSGGTLKLCCLSKKLKDLFAVTRLDAVFETHETEAAAIASAEAK